MPWCRVRIFYNPTGYTQNYKRHISVHSHLLSQQFTRDALRASLRLINANLPVGYTPNPVTANLLGISQQADQLAVDPGPNYRTI